MCNLRSMCDEKDLQQWRHRKGSSSVWRSKWCFRPMGTLNAVSHSGHTRFFARPLSSVLWHRLWNISSYLHAKTRSQISHINSALLGVRFQSTPRSKSLPMPNWNESIFYGTGILVNFNSMTYFVIDLPFLHALVSLEIVIVDVPFLCLCFL